MKVVVERREWRRGRGHSALYSCDEFVGGKFVVSQYCVIGQVLRELGVPPDRLRSVSTPRNLDSRTRRGLPAWLFELQFHEKRTAMLPQGAVWRAMRLNDAEGLSESERELRLTQILAEVGVELVFTDERNV